MELDAVIGIILLAGALCPLTLLTFLSRRTINRIAARRLASLRRIMKDLRE